ncbi:hypothetical protein [Qipengyuania gelatinilytica]|uniref:Zinc ribbon domain-containing protein n=1 Tax=Qipengyuania gelatinilytica TaxID=2867231 RepID=A0ABX9A4Y4_9SPHN|nr:hypothetical protein [Qipengyuania gelatinilytica]QZD94963.1 hypothetical protein K3136_12935 [Qipengyuania gelatinilytica]
MTPIEDDPGDFRETYNRRSLASCGGCLFVVFLLPYLLWLIGLGTEANVPIFLILAALAVAWSIWARMSVKCPRCGRPLGYSPVAPPVFAPKICHGCGLDFEKAEDR